MGIPIRVLIVEDVEDDAELLMQELRSKGYDPQYERVDTQKAMLEALDRQTWDIIICDYSMPGFNAISALKLMHKIHNDLPFILVSGTIGEEVAVEAMKAGAHDYIMKDKLSRFVPAIERELVEYKERIRVRQMENAIQTLVKGTVGVTGQEFFDRIVGSMCEWLGTDCAFIGQIANEVNVTALSMQLDRRLIHDYSYTIGDGPCAVVVKDGYYSYTDGVCKLFPDSKVISELKAEGYVGVSLRDKSEKVIGILWTVSQHKLNIPLRTADVMEIIAAKASAEIERMQTEADLQKSEEKYRAVFEQAICSNIVLDGDTGEIIEFNTHAHENLGYTRKEFKDLKIADIDIIENDEEVRKHIEKVIKNGSDIFETKHRGKDGKIHDMIISAKCLSVPGRNIISTQWNDITERKNTEEQIKASLREKEVLLKEIHHRVKNNMQVISSLLNMQSETIKDDNVLRIFKESQNRVKSMALVHELLYQTNDFSSIDFGEYTRSLTTRLLYSFGDITKGIQLKIDMDEVYLDVNRAIPCGLIINEIVTNSFKHAFPLRTTGAEKRNEGARDISKDKDIIKITMRKNADPESRTRAGVNTETIELVISDNGIGLPDDINFQNTKTMGLELANTLVGQLRGTIKHVNDGGTEVKITFEV